MLENEQQQNQILLVLYATSYDMIDCFLHFYPAVTRKRRRRYA